VPRSRALRGGPRGRRTIEAAISKPTFADRAPLIHRGRSGELPVLRESIGRSVRGRPIYGYLLGPPGGRAVLVVGCTDGDEPAGMAIVTALRRLEPPIGVDLWFIPTINPDGVAVGATGNAHGVDLNRNFPYRWRNLGGSGHFNSGPRPLSEPETRALHRFLLRIKPRLAIWFHQPLALVDDSQGSPRLERTFGRLIGLPLRPLTDVAQMKSQAKRRTFDGRRGS
jgi:protein MpaA